jgi:hypothetical protein
VSKVHRAPWAILLVVVVTTVSLKGQPAGDGEIIGRITGVDGGVIPGARVLITSGDERRETFTDPDGRFALLSLRLGTYNVAVELHGFFTRSGTIALSPTVRRAHVAWQLEVGCLEEGAIVHVVPTPRDAATLAQAIVHAQVKSDDDPMLWSHRPDCPGVVVQSYTAEVLNVVGRGSDSVARGSTQQISQMAHGTRLQPGAGYVAFVGTGLILEVVSGRISSPAGESLTGMTVEEALDTLDRWSREGPQ